MLKTLLKIIYGLIVLAVGTAISVYFVSLAISDHHEEVAPDENQSVFIDYVEKIESEYDSFKRMESHFHSSNNTSIPKIETQEICLRCHSLFPHELKKQTRSFNNQHSTFMSCQSCHIELTTFKWINILENELVSKDEITEKIQTHNDLNLTDLYIHKIVPLQQGKPVIEYYNDSKYSDQLDDIKSTNDASFQSVRKEAEKDLSETPKTCVDCHSDNSTFPWEELQYSQTTIDQMKDNAVVNMVTKYETFHFPKSE